MVSISIRILQAIPLDSGMAFVEKIMSIKLPINTMFRIVPRPSFSPEKKTKKPIKIPVTIYTVPTLTRIVFAAPTWNTSQGAYPNIYIYNNNTTQCIKKKTPD